MTGTVNFAAALAALISNPGVPSEELDRIKAGLLALAAEPADAEQAHLVDEIEHADDYDHFQHGDFPRCCGEHSQPITISFCTLPDEAGQ